MNDTNRNRSDFRLVRSTTPGSSNDWNLVSRSDGSVLGTMFQVQHGPFVGLWMVTGDSDRHRHFSTRRDAVDHLLSH